MAVSPKQLLDAAHELAEGSREVDFRNAASRAYYAAYHRCRPIAKRNGLRSSDRGVHSDVIDALRTATKPRLKQLAQLLTRCRGLRAKADYNIDEDFRRSEARASTRQAQRIFAVADEFEGTSTSS